MKKSLLFSLMALFMLSLFQACNIKNPLSPNGSDKADAENIRIDSVMADTLYTYGTGKDAPTCNILIHFPFAEGKMAAELNDSLASKLEEYAKIRPTTREEFQSAVEKGALYFLNLFKSDLQDATEDQPDYMRGGGYFINVSYAAHTVMDSVLVCQIYEDTYTGGAHGNHAISYYNVNRSNGHVITLADICPANRMQQLTDSIVASLVKQYECKSLDELRNEHAIFMLCDTPVVAQNFYFDANGITFVYNEYEIAPYACGIIETTLSYGCVAAATGTKRLDNISSPVPTR